MLTLWNFEFEFKKILTKISDKMCTYFFFSVLDLALLSHRPILLLIVESGIPKINCHTSARFKNTYESITLFSDKHKITNLTLLDKYLYRKRQIF